MSALLNLGSLLLGLIAWIVPILSMKRSVKYGIKNVIILSLSALVLV